MTLSKKQKLQKDYDHYITTYSGRTLLSKHSLDETGVWQVFGEDPNCDFGGHHHEPFLGLIEGKLDDVIYEAVSYSGFFQWGGGGRITKYKNPGVAKAKTSKERDALDNAERDKLSKKREELERELASVTAKLNALK